MTWRFQRVIANNTLRNHTERQKNLNEHLRCNSYAVNKFSLTFKIVNLRPKTSCTQHSDSIRCFTTSAASSRLPAVTNTTPKNTHRENFTNSDLFYELTQVTFPLDQVNYFTNRRDESIHLIG